MEYIIEGLKRLWTKPQDRPEVLEGYLLMTDNKQNKSLFFIKDNNKCWKTKWIDNTTKVNKPSTQMESIFTNQ